MRVDHIGLNIPTATMDELTWTTLLKFIAARTNQYRYPTGEDWPFILPATDAEFEADISSFAGGREPRFELVYDEYLRHPLLQYALVTNLTKEEAERLFSGPYGLGLPDLAQYFYSVYIAHPWAALSIRFDLYYAGNGGYGDFQTGKWLVQAGGRIRP